LAYFRGRNLSAIMGRGILSQGNLTFKLETERSEQRSPRSIPNSPIKRGREKRDSQNNYEGENNQQPNKNEVTKGEKGTNN